MYLIVEGSADKVDDFHPLPMLKCDRVSYVNNCIMLDMSQRKIIKTRFPENLTLAIDKKDLMKLAKILIDDLFINEKGQDEKNNNDEK